MDKNSSNSGSRSSNFNAPTPPPPLPLNIPAKNTTPARPQPRPVPAPRPKPLPSARSYGSSENLADRPEVKLNNLSQDEASDYHGSRDKLDQYSPKKAPSYNPEPLQHMSRSREKLNDVTTHQRFPSNDTSEGGRVSTHGSRENLLPKRTDSDTYRPPNYQPPLQPPAPRLQDMYGGNQQQYPYSGSAPGVDYMPRNDYSDGSPGVEYLPRSLGTPMKNRHMIGHQQTPSSSDYESYDGVPAYIPSPRLADTTPGHYDYHPQTQNPDPSSQNVPYSNVANSNVDYLPRNTNPQTSRSRDNLSRSRENLARSRDNISSPMSYGNMSLSRENLSHSRDNMARSRENLSRSRENLSRSRENLGPPPSYMSSDIDENSRDIEKPRQQKSIETEI